MAIVADLARTGVQTGGEYNTVYQKGNDNANTPNPTWVTMLSYPDGALITETHVTARADVTPWAPIDNRADAWLPLVEATFLSSTPATVR